jgi:transcriptional regulator with XRE-family HTH domain
MDRDSAAEARWPADLEAIVAKSVRSLREGRGISQHQLGSDLLLHRCGMTQAGVDLLESGQKPLRLNEVAAIAAYFDVPVESLWQPGGELLKEHQRAFLLRAAVADEAEQRASAYYSQQRSERLRDK